MGRWRRSGRLVLVGLVLLMAAAMPSGCSTSRDAVGSPSDPPGGSLGSTPDGDLVRALLTAARVVERRPDIPGYERDCGPGDGCVFGTEWSDDTDAPLGHNGCDTRNDVLGATLDDVAFDPRSNGCDVVAGRLVDPYTGTVMDYATEGSQIHIDHLFPLAAAWDLGAASWPIVRRSAFANDTDLELLAVQGAANLQKGDSTPASWIPPLLSFRCTYVALYLTVANSYDLAITAADVRVIEAVVRKSC